MVETQGRGRNGCLDRKRFCVLDGDIPQSPFWECKTNSNMLLDDPDRNLDN